MLKYIIIHTKKMNNILPDLFILLNVQYTSIYSSLLCNELPHKNNLYRLSQDNLCYNIENAGIKFNNKEGDILEIYL